MGDLVRSDAVGRGHLGLSHAWWTEYELAYAIEDSGASVVLADPERVARMTETCTRLGVRVIAVRSADDAGVPGVVERYEDVVELGTPMPKVAIDPEDDATILYTSGTTGAPKGAVSPHRAVIQALLAFGCRQFIELARAEGPPAQSATPAYPPTLILAVPLFHVTGCIPVMLSSFATGMKLVIMYRWDAEKALQLIESERVTMFVGVPTQSWDLIESPNFHKYDTSSLASIAGGGAPAPPTLVRRVDEEFGAGRPAIGYGMTETNAYGPGNSGDDYVSHPSSAGRVVPIMQIEVRDGDDNPVPAGQRGEICFKGPNLIRGYWNRPADTAETIVKGWLRTGDIGYLDADGFIYVEDRAKDMVLRGGENIYSAEVEAAIYEHPAVYEGGGVRGARPAARRRGGSGGGVEARRHPERRGAAGTRPAAIGPLQGPVPDHVSRPSSSPRSATGKILKRDIRTSLYPDPKAAG